jgi:uridine kinase
MIGGLEVRNKPVGMFVFLWFISRATLIWILGAVPAPLHENLYGPFIDSFISFPTLDPWTNWLAQAGTSDAFPYGWPMLLVLAAGQTVGLLFGSAWIGFLSTLLVLDFLTFLILVNATTSRPESTNFIAGTYLLSPLPVLTMFILGSTDFLPMLLLVLALSALGSNKPVIAGIILGVAVGSKLILAVALVGALLYFARSGGGRGGTIALSTAFGLTLALSMSPLFYSQGFRKALADSDDATGPLIWGIPSPTGNLLLLPLIVFTVWFAVYQLGRMNANLLALALATPLLVTASLPGAPIGWSLWSMPLVILLASHLATRFRVLGFFAVNSTSFLFLASLFEKNLGIESSDLLRGIMLTSSLAIAIATSVLLWREHYTRSDFIRLRSRPALVLIAGDSGVGKDTLADGLASILGRESTVHISGDDYHRWDRGHGSWQHLTHLNPNANELPRFFNDILTLTDGGEIRNGKYDHRIGRRLSSETARGREFVIASGLHSLLIGDMNRQASLTVFLEMSEDLRAKLKLQRDTENRGHKAESVLKSLEERKADSLKFIQPQRRFADLVVTSSIIDVTNLSDAGPIEVTFESDPKLFDAQLLSELSITCGLEVTTEPIGNNRRKISVRGSSRTADLASAFTALEPRVSAILGAPKSWGEGPAGIIQMVVMVYLGNALRRERLVK